MAFRWRIRHKLRIGLMLVVAIIGLLLLGSLYGLDSFRATMQSMSSKLEELKAAQALTAAIETLEQHVARPDDHTIKVVLDDLSNGRDKLTSYEQSLAETLSHGRDPDRGFNERVLLKQLRGLFDELENKARKITELAVVESNGDRDGGLLRELKPAIAQLKSVANQLITQILEWQKTRIGFAQARYRTSLRTIVGVSVAGVLLLCSLLTYFYAWVFYPIRDLECGAGRVARGDFDFRIEVKSGDEMEDLANAFNDMTSRLSETYHDLERQVNERSRQLVRSERLASVGFLAAGVAHEINNPLASIAFCSEALEQRLREWVGNPVRNEARPQEPDEAVIAKYLKMIQEEAFRCKAITQRLLEFSRGGEKVREPVDVAKLVQSVVDMVEHLETSHGKSIVFDPARRVVAWVNAQEIKSVILNLVVNALESMDEGGELRVGLTQRAGTAVLEFADTGCGMTAETLENIFEPFYTRSRTGKGTGLGLSISHRVINQHGGEIEAVSPGLNQGSTFTVRLPLQPAEDVKEESLGHVAA